LSRPRKLTPEHEAAIMAWYSQYQKALSELKRLGSIPLKAKEYGISTRTLHSVAKRPEEKVRRVLGRRCA
jgi:hypothetical protein